MNAIARTAACAFLLACTIAIPRVASAGPPFLTDDPVPVDPGHAEAYLFATSNAQSGSTSNVAWPAVELNWGAAPNVQLHVVTPFENVTTLGAPNAYGFGDVEVGVKYRFVPESDDRPQIATFPAAEFPTGDASRGLGNGRTWYRLPLWLQKGFDRDRWIVDTGGGIVLNDAPGQRSYGFAGFLVQRAFGPGLTLGAEIYTQGAVADGALPSTLYNVGAVVNPSAQFSILLSLGHSVAGAAQSIGYAGLYYTFPHPAGP